MIGLFALVAVFPLGHLLLRPLEIRYPSAPDFIELTGIIVLGGSEDVERSHTWQMPLVNGAGDRVFKAAALAHQFPEIPILITGRNGALDPSERKQGNIVAELLVDLDVPRERLLIEEDSRNTFENARLSIDLIEELSEGTWVLVTSAFHMPRAMATFCSAGWTNLVAWPTDYRTSYFRAGVGWDPAQHITDLNLGLKEWIGITAYRLTGRLQNPDADCAQSPTPE